MNCRNCIHAKAKPESRAMNALGFRNCAHLPSYHYVAGRNVCRIGKFEATPISNTEGATA